MHEQQTTADVLMIRPASFCANAQTAGSNAFQQLKDVTDAQTMAAAEFDALVHALREAGVRAHVCEDSLDPQTPDALFPNNWVSFHADGTVVLYPMLAPNRRFERRADILESLPNSGFRVSRIVDLSAHEASGHFLEGTGSLVLDRVNRIAYACRSPRTDPIVLGDFAQKLGYQLVVFEAFDRDGRPIYHTNVLMCIGTRFAAVCLSAIRDEQRDAVRDRLDTTGHEVVELAYDQMLRFAGNMLELSTIHGNRIVALSAAAAAALTAKQRSILHMRAGPLVSAYIPTIEALGGGSVRCMIAELHLPRAP